MMGKVNNNSYYEKHRKYYEKAVRMYFEEGLGYRRISKLIPVAVTTLARWCDTFAKENGITMEKKVPRKKSPAPLEPNIAGVADDVASLKAEVSRLRKALKQEQLRADAFDAMIDVAEARFNIPIRKKAGAKQ